MIEKDQIEAPCNTFPSQITGPSGEEVYWAPAGSCFPVCPDDIDEQLVRELFHKAALTYADILNCFDSDIVEAARKNEKGMKKLQHEAYPEAIPFISVSSIPLNEKYFEDKYFICYFTSRPHKLADKSYLTVGVIGP